MGRFWANSDSHPAYCTCVRCTNARLVRPAGGGDSSMTAYQRNRWLRRAAVSVALMAAGGALAVLAVPWFPDWMAHGVQTAQDKIASLDAPPGAAAAVSNLQLKGVACGVNVFAAPLRAYTSATATNTDTRPSPATSLKAVYVSDLGHDVYEVNYTLPALQGLASSEITINGPIASGNSGQFIKVTRCDIVEIDSGRRTRGAEYRGLLEIQIPVNSPSR